MKPTLAALGAVDRYNYGDLLFPLVLSKAWSKLGLDQQVAAYGMRASDLSRFGALPTRSYRHLLHDIRDKTVEGLMLAGGELLGSRWSTMLMYLSTTAGARSMKLARQAIGADTIDRIVRWAHGAPSAWPWVLAPTDLPRVVPVAYNAVGGITALQRMRPAELEAVVAKLSQATYVSVRDSVTASKLRSAGLDSVHLAPDSAVLISDLFPMEHLTTLVRPSLVELVSRNSPYLAIQVNSPVGSEHVATLATQIDEVADSLGINVVLVPIGRASGHEDHVPLGRIGNRSRTPVSSIPDDATVFEVMYVIASASIFGGTSLHGSITAFAFDRPHLAISSRVPKLLAHLESWSLPELAVAVDPAVFASAVQAALKLDPDRLRTARLTAQASAWENLSRMAQALA